MKEPVIVYLFHGRIYTLYATWSIRSLLQHGYSAIEVVVGNEREKEWICREFPLHVRCRVLNVNIGEYPAFSYKPFALMEYMKQCGLFYSNRDIVICDADVLWKRDPRPLFERFEKKNWAHKITSVDPNEFEKSIEIIPHGHIATRTIINYKNRFGLDVYPNFVVNAGLFMLEESLFEKVLTKWYEMLVSMPPEEMLMSEALMSIVYAKMGLRPTGDDIKYSEQRYGNVEFPVVKFEESEPPKPGFFTGYETARHYFTSQAKKEIPRDVRTMKLDPDDLARLLRWEQFRSNVGKFPRRLKRKIQNFFR